MTTPASLACEWNGHHWDGNIYKPEELDMLDNCATPSRFWLLCEHCGLKARYIDHATESIRKSLLSKVFFLGDSL